MDLFWLSAQHCARQHATALLALWALTLALAGGAAYARRFGWRAVAIALGILCALTVAHGIADFAGCSLTAASEQGLGTTLPAGTYTTLKCLGHDFTVAPGWIALMVSCAAAIVLAAFGIVRSRGAARIAAFAGSALLLVVAVASGFLLLFAFSWCTSARLL